MTEHKKLIEGLNQFLNIESKSEPTTEIQEESIIIIEVAEEPESDRAVLLAERELKIKNVKWVIHKGDSDPWPSNPYAHNYAEQIKLHLGTGEMFKTNDRKSIGYYDKKKFLFLRDKLNEMDLPKLNYRS